MPFARLQPLCLAVHLSVAVLSVGAPLTSAQVAPQHYDIAAGPLADALNRFAQQAGVALVIDAHKTQSLRTRGLHGSYGIDDGFRALLQGTGFEAVPQADGGYTLRPLSAPADAPVTLQSVKISADAVGAQTEGSGNYAARAVTIGRTTQTQREIPQSVTVMTRQLIDDQRLDTVDDLMVKMPGISVARDNIGYSGFWSRGFQINNYQLDGVTVAYDSPFRPNQDLALYDRVEVLRGADGLFAGTGEAGGTINFVRKRPLDSRQILLNVSAGRWDNYRAEVDVSSPLAFDGKLRGRTVVVYQDREFFYSPSDEKKELFYGILEADVTSSTRLWLGASHQKNDGVHWLNGLPRQDDGSSIRLSRSSALTFDWAERSNTSIEYFAGIEQKLGEDWTVRASTARQDYDSEDYMAYVNGPIDRETAALANVGASYEEVGNKAEAYDIYVAGSFALLGRTHKLTVGTDWQKSKAAQMRFRLALPDYSAPGNIFDFDPGAYPKLGVIGRDYGWPAYGAEQRGLYAKLQAQLSDDVQLIVGGRRSSYDYNSPDYDYAAGEPVLASDYGYRESGIFTPYAGVVYDIARDWSVYASVAEIHKSQASMLKGPLPGSPLDAITGRTFEIGAKGEQIAGKLNTQLALYRIEREGEGVTDPAYPNTPDDDGLTCCYLEQGDVVSEGVDTELSGEVAPGWQLMLGYTYNRNRNKDADAAYHALTPKHLLKAWTSYRLPGRWSQWNVGGGVTTQSNRANSGLTWVNNGGEWSQVPFRVEQGGYTVWQAQAGYRIDDHWSLALNLNNVFDKVYYESIGTNASGNWYGEPRSWVVTVSGQF